MTIKVIANGNVLSAVITQTDDGITSSYNDIAEVQEETVRANLTVGEKTNIGSSTVVKARDENTQVLGSFLGGFLVSPCK